MDKAVSERRRTIAEERETKKIREAKRLRGVPPEVTVRQAFELMTFTRRISEAADHAERQDA